MMKRLTGMKRAGLALALAAAGLGAATTVQARDRHRGGDDAVIAIGAGIVGLALGAALADRDDRYYDDRRWHSQRRYVRASGYPDYYYYYNNNPRRYYRDRYYDRHYRHWYGRQGYDRWDRRHDRWDRRHDRWHRHKSWDDGYRSGRDYRYRDYRYRDDRYRD